MTRTNPDSAPSASRTGRLQRPRGAWMAVVIIILGVTSLLLQMLTSSIRERLLAEDVAQLRAIGDVQAHLATSHLWMEEYVTGDPGGRAEIWTGISSARTLVKAMLSGGELRSTRQAIRAVAEPNLRRDLTAFAARIEHFSRISEQRVTRYRAGENVAPGSNADARYDAVFGELIADALDLRTRIEGHVTRSVDRSRLLANIVLAVLASMVMLALIGFVFIERRRAAAEQALLRSELDLAQAQKMDAVGRLAGGLAHDINNYLAAIVAQCDLVARRAAADTSDGSYALRERMRGVIGIANRAARLIQRLLAFSRPRAPRVEVLDLSRTVADLLPLLRQLLGNEVRVSASLDATAGNVRIDPAHIEQVIVNLAVNAREAMSGAGDIRLATRAARFETVGTESTTGEYAVLEVSDSGTGIPADVQERMFEPFFTTRSGSSNSGLGLATVYALVRQSGGFIRVHSTTGAGANFAIHLPRTPEPALPRPTPSGERIASLEGRRVLLIDDNQHLREPIAAQLESMGFEVASFDSGDAALEDLGQRPPHLVVTDIAMPGLSGPDLARRLAAAYGPLRVLFLSGFNDSVLGDFHSPDIVHRFLQKPFTSDDFAKALAEVLSIELPDRELRE